MMADHFRVIGADASVLVFIIDRTGSMGRWIEAVRQVLPSIVHSVALTNIFDYIAILTYSDYDLKVEKVVTFSGFCNVLDASEVRNLEAFAAGIPTEGGAGAPEAFKTAMLAFASKSKLVPNARRVHVLHLTDAPPHTNGCSVRLDHEGEKERVELGEMFEWSKVVLEVISAYPTLRYTALVTDRHQLYCHLAQVTGGSVHLPGGVDASNIRKQLGRVINGWLGLPDPIQQRFVLDSSDVDAGATEDEVMAASVRAATEAEQQGPPKCPVISTALLKSLRMMRTDGTFREHVISEMQKIIEMDAVALTASPIVGKMWRELCKSRSDLRRDEMIEVMNNAKNKLGPSDRATMEEWLKDSYNVQAEIDAFLLDFMRANETKGLLRFVPEDDTLCAQQIVQLLARGDRKSTAIIRAILSRMYVDHEAALPMAGVSMMEEEVAAPPAPEAPPSSSSDDTMADEKETYAMMAPILQELRNQPQYFKSALVVLPSKSLASQADMLRCDHDKAFPRWMAHITLLFPFHNAREFPQVVRVLETVLGDPAEALRRGFPAPFALECSKVSWFPGRNAVMHVVPEEPGLPAGSKSSLEKLYCALLSLFPNMKRSDRDAFHAHLTLGQCPCGDADQLRGKFQAIFDGGRDSDSNVFNVGEFHLVSHLTGEDRFRVIHTFHLPAETSGSIAFARPSAKKNVGELETEDEDGVPPLPMQTIPVNLPIERFFELVMHTVAPGTKLTRRYAAMLAMHAIQCGSVLADFAKEYLQSIRGRWINWRRKEDETMAPEVPENFAGNFLYLLTSEDVVKHACTAEEFKFARFLIKVLTSLRFFRSLEVEVKLLDYTSADGTFPDHAFECQKCTRRRPLSLISEKGVCGYCATGSEGFPAMDAEKQLQVRCHDCGSFYARSSDSYVPGHSKCFGCRGKDVGERLVAPFPSPSVECVVCNNRIVQFYKTGAGLPEGGRCGPCANGCPPRRLSTREFISLAHQIFSEQSQFLALAAQLGLEPVDADKADVAPVVVSMLQKGFDASTSVAEAAMMFRETSGPPSEVVDIPGRGCILFRDQEVQNVDEIWSFVSAVMNGTASPLEAECSVCMSVPEKENGGGRVLAACGRRGCKQRVCASCSRSWYGMNEPGKLLHPRSCLCQFCARIPTRKATRGANPMLQGLCQHIRSHPLEQDSYYAWCQLCFVPVVLANRACVAAGEEQLPQLEGYTCDACRQRTHAKIDGEIDELVAKNCPKCAVSTQKVSGCNHMSCPCGAHWCWQCAAFCADNAGDCYHHMQSEHGGYFDFEVNGDWEEDEDDEGEDDDY